MQVEEAMRKCQAEAGEVGRRLLKAAEEEKVGGGWGKGLGSLITGVNESEPSQQRVNGS
jgi:hypothetical protein